MLLEDFEIP